MKLTKSILGLFLAAALIVTSCGDDDSGPSGITLDAMTASGADVISGDDVTIDLNGATVANGVPIEPTISITFSREVDDATITPSNVMLSYDGVEVSSTTSTDGAVVTLVPSVELLRGSDFVVTLSDDIRAADGGVFITETRTFTTGGVAPVTPPHVASQVAHWTFDGTTMDALGNYSTANEIKVAYTTDRHGQFESTISFDGDETLVEIAGADQLLATDDFTLSFWMKSNSSDQNENEETRAQFVMGLAAWHGFQFEIFGNYGGCKLAARYTLEDGGDSAQDLWWSTSGNLGWQGWTFDKDVSASGGLGAIVADQWAHVICTYDAATKIASMYMNGELVKSQDYNLYGENHPMYTTVGMGYTGNEDPGNRLAFGFIQGSENRIVADDWANPIGFPDNNHFKGELDDVRFFHASFTADDAKDLYDDEKP